MSIHLVCLTNNGLPIFNRKIGDCDSLPFSTVGSLNGVHMFCKNQGVDLKQTHLEDGLIIWEEFDDYLLFVGISKGVPENVLRFLLQLAYNAILLTIGIHELQLSPRNPDRLKRELKIAIGIVDRLMEEATSSSKLLFTDCLLSDQNMILMDRLNEFSIQFGSPYACLLIRQKISVATEGWWDLDIVDRKLPITMLLTSTTLQHDVPVFLPKKSPNIAYRFISVPIVQNVYLCVLCGAEPLYLEVQNLAQQIYNSAFNCLQLADQSVSRNIPDAIQLDPTILGLLLINRTLAKCVAIRNVQQQPQSGSPAAAAVAAAALSNNYHRLDALRTFYNQAINNQQRVICRRAKEVVVNNLETYWCSDYYKLHTLVRQENVICVMFMATVPIHTMRVITASTLDSILAEREVCW